MRFSQPKGSECLQLNERMKEDKKQYKYKKQNSNMKSGFTNSKNKWQEKKKKIETGTKEQAKTPIPKDGVCPYARNCGGCDYQGLSYPKQLKKKQEQVHKLLSSFGRVEKIVGMEDPLHYRHKVHAVFGCQKGGKIVAGVYKKNTHEIVDIEESQIEDAKADAIIREVKNLLKSFRIKAYNEDSEYGLLRHVMVRKGYATGQYMVILVLASPILPSKNNFVKALRKNHPEITTIVLNVNEKRTSMVLGERNINLYGKGYIEDELCGCTFRISPNSFYQVNPKQTEKLYNQAIACAGLTGKERVLDAYCGTGTIGIIASRHAREVIGVELNKDAVKDAVINAKRNEVKNIRFHCEDATEFLLRMAEEKEQLDVVIMDPPRTGSTEAFLESVVKVAPKKIVYVSCNPETLARDLQKLTGRGYCVKQCVPFDLFPMTEHTEVVVQLEKR